MKPVICKNYEEMSAYAAKEIAAAISAKPNFVLGLPTGSTPVGMYKELVAMNKSGKVDFSAVTTFNLDEYYPIKRDNSQSYYTFMYENLFSHININHDNVNIPNGEAEDPDAEGAAYDAKIKACGGVDLQILGSGVNGHIGFNEPDSSLVLGTHKTSLTQNTIEVNSRFFNDISEVPTHALTMGIKTIFDAKRIIILLNGDNKAHVLDTMFSGTITTACPASLLALHANVTVVTDEATASKTKIFG